MLSANTITAVSLVFQAELWKRLGCTEPQAVTFAVSAQPTFCKAHAWHIVYHILKQQPSNRVAPPTDLTFASHTPQYVVLCINLVTLQEWPAAHQDPGGTPG